MQRYMTMFVISKEMPIITVAISVLADQRLHEYHTTAADRAKEIYSKTFPGIHYTSVITKYEKEEEG